MAKLASDFNGAEKSGNQALSNFGSEIISQPQQKGAKILTNNLKLEPREKDMLIQAVELLIDQHGCPFCTATWKPILDKLRSDRDRREAIQAIIAAQVPSELLPPKVRRSRGRPARAHADNESGPKRWTAEEDAVLRKYAASYPLDFAAIEAELPGRAPNKVRGRLSRLGLDKVYKVSPSEPTPPPSPTPSSTPSASSPPASTTLPTSPPSSSSPPTSSPSPTPAATPAPTSTSTSTPPSTAEGKIATTGSTKDWDWTQRGPERDKLMSRR